MKIHIDNGRWIEVSAGGKRYIAFLVNDEYCDLSMPQRRFGTDVEANRDDTNPYYYKRVMNPEDAEDMISINGDIINPHSIEFRDGTLYISGTVAHSIGGVIDDSMWEYFELEISDDNGLVILKVEKEDI